jgi:N-acetylglucosaminyldiphosphoundecaprenol N-acetyl-beta-D-mannosaminyltransferase
MTSEAVAARSPAHHTHDRVDVLGLGVDRVDMTQALARCEELIRVGGVSHYVAVNVAKVIAARTDRRLREIVHEAALVSADGQPIVWASRLLGDPLPERVAGIDLMEALLELAEERGYGVFIVGARDDVLRRAVERLRERHRRLRIVGHRDGYFPDSESDAICAEIRRTRPHILFVAMSSPRKDYWVADHAQELEVPLILGVGGSIDVIAGETRRAPRWMRRAGLEWLFRLVQEPRRLWRRYFTTNARFGLLLVRAIAGRAVRRARRG